MSRQPPTSLEETLELLEARFTQPLSLMKNGNTSNMDHSNLSEHSFSFAGNSNHGNVNTTNTGANSNSTLQNALLLVNSNHGANGVASPMSASSSNTSKSLQRLHQATTKHMQKIAGSRSRSPTTFRNLKGRSHSPSAHSNSSQQTLVTGNKHGKQTRNQTKTKKNRVVAESPPMLISPANGSGKKQNGKTNTATTATTNATSAAQPVTAEKEKPHVARALLTNATNGNSSSSTKRKSNPKRKVSSIQDALDEQADDAAAAGATAKDSAAASAITSTATTATSMASPQKAKNTAKRVRTSFENSSANASRSPQKSNFLNGNENNSRSNHSRSNPPRSSSSGKRTSTTSNAPPTNNKSIHDFFTTVTNKKANSNKKATAGSATTTTKSDAKADIDVAETGKSATSAPTTSNVTSTSTSATVDWEAQCQKLQQQLQDKEEQLKAVRDNKTILHTALQSALTKTKQDFEEFQQTTQENHTKTFYVLEDLLRWRSTHQAKELRGKLAADGARLGKVVYKRAGMRAAMESWEEGYATKDLQIRKDDWKRRMRALLERQEAYQQKQAKEQQQEGKESTASQDQPSSTETMSPLKQLEAQEEAEAIEMHMEALRQEEKELMAADQALNDEKAAHIRALKRVESEDSSRFFDRPKLHDRYVLDRLLGKGGFSEVWRGFDLKELREVAVKIHQLDPRWPNSKKDNYTKHVTREYEIHRDVRHPRIVSLYDVFEIDANSFATVLECCKGTDLDTLLKSKKRLPERHARAMLLQILSGMQYLSQPDGSRQGIIHYDLKPGNILFDEAGDAKITDFGLSKIVDAADSADSMELTSQGAGTYWYLPPECFFTGEQVRISNKVDVWSIGVIFYQMLYGRRPFGEGQTQDKILANCTMLNAQQVHIPEKPDVSEAGKDFVRLCLTYDQADRPTMAQLCANPYVLQGGMN